MCIIADYNENSNGLIALSIPGGACGVASFGLETAKHVSSRLVWHFGPLIGNPKEAKDITMKVKSMKNTTANQHDTNSTGDSPDVILHISMDQEPSAGVCGASSLLTSCYSPLIFKQAKDVRFGNEARQSIQRGVARSVAAVATTLGPMGRNVIMEHTFGDPKMTKDGVTVAKAIQFVEPFENMGAQLVRQVCNKTSDMAGDGTTTSAVLVESIFSEGMKYIAHGTNPIDMKRGMDVAVDYVHMSLLKQSRQVKGLQEMTQVATISANGDAEIGKMVASAMEVVGRDGVVSTKDGQTTKTELEVTTGMKIDKGYISSYFVTDEKRQTAVLEDTFVLVCHAKISNINILLPTLNHVLNAGKPLLIIADDVESEALTTLIYNKMQGKLKVCCVKAPEFGETKTDTLEDIAAYTGATALNAEGSELKLSEDTFNPIFLGKAKRVTVGKEETVIVEGAGDEAAIGKRKDVMREHIVKETVEYNRQKIQERLARISGGVAVIKVGGASEVEALEKNDRIADALCSTRAALDEGIVPGGGVALLRAVKKLDEVARNPALTRDQRIGVEIVRNAIRLPAMRIAANAGKNGAVVAEKILENENEAVGYDARNDRYVNMFEAGIIDPARVVRVAITDATSVASMMMTAEAGVANLVEDEEKHNNNTIPVMNLTNTICFSSISYLHLHIIITSMPATQMLEWIPISDIHY
eukprot:gene5127-3681_t